MYKYYLIYKPFQVLSQFSPSPGKLTLKNLFDVEQDVYPVGRLDYDSEGLLLLTNDVRVNKQWLHPTQKVEKEYYVQVEGEITTAALQQLESGVTISIDGTPYKTKPAKAHVLPTPPILPERNPPIRYRAHIPTSWISLTIGEGKNRQVRRMTAAVGFPTLRLVRWRQGHLTMKGMQPGDMQQLTKLDGLK
jgi:23S rRNA pseudouridine2457 synthase